MSYEAWGDGDEFGPPDGYVTEERAQEYIDIPGALMVVRSAIRPHIHYSDRLQR